MVLASGHGRMRRLERVAQTLGDLPVDRRGLSEALKHFLATGEMPRDERYADAVVCRTLFSYDDDDWESVQPILQTMARLHASGELALGPPPPPTPRDRLLRETLDPEPAVREAARRAVRDLVAAGRDLRDEALLGSLEVHDGPVGVQVLASLAPGGKPPRVRRSGGRRSSADLAVE